MQKNGKAGFTSVDDLFKNGKNCDQITLRKYMDQWHYETGSRVENPICTVQVYRVHSSLSAIGNLQTSKSASF